MAGRNVWRTDLDQSLSTAATLLGCTGEVSAATSCSLLHVPYDVEAESSIDEQVESWLAFARQKVSEVVVVARALREGRQSVAEDRPPAARASSTGRIRAVFGTLRSDSG